MSSEVQAFEVPVPSGAPLWIIFDKILEEKSTPTSIVEKYQQLGRMILSLKKSNLALFVAQGAFLSKMDKLEYSSKELTEFYKKRVNICYSWARRQVQLFYFVSLYPRLLNADVNVGEMMKWLSRLNKHLKTDLDLSALLAQESKSIQSDLPAHICVQAFAVKKLSPKEQIAVVSTIIQ